jgi:hypothetical protein
MRAPAICRECEAPGQGPGIELAAHAARAFLLYIRSYWGKPVIITAPASRPASMMSPLSVCCNVTAWPQSHGAPKGGLPGFRQDGCICRTSESVAASEEDRPLFAGERAFIGCDSSTASIRSIISLLATDQRREKELRWPLGLAMRRTRFLR